jgi:hypothetical protein
MPTMNDLRVEFLGSYLWLTILLCLTLLGIVCLYYRRTTPPLKKPVRWLLTMLRGFAFIALFLALAQPIISYSVVQHLKRRMAVLLDCSASMKLPLNTDTVFSRLQKAEEILDGSVLSRLRDEVDFDYYSFAESLDFSRQGLNLSGNKTDPGQALIQLRQSKAVNPYDYILLISDGRATEGENLPDLAGSFDQPIFTVAVGDSGRIGDVSLDRVDFDKIIFAGRQAEIKVIVSQQGSFAGKFRLKLSDEKRVLAEKSVIPPGDGRKCEYGLSYTPAIPGRLILDLNVSAPGDEKNRLNNRRRFSVRVLKSKLRILLYASSLNQEYAFLNRFLKNRNDYELVRVVDAPGGDRLGERFPNTQEKLNSFDLVIMIDPNLNRVRSHYEKIVSFLSDRGGGLLLLTGEEYVRSAAGNRLAELSPLAITPDLEMPYRYGRFHLVPDQRMIFHPALKLADTREEIVAVWGSRPPFTAVAPVDSVRSSGVALGYLGSDHELGNVPVMALRRMGAGKILSIAVSPFWHWAFYPVGVGRDTGPYKDFFAAAIRWLTIGDESDRISFRPVKEVFESGEEVVFDGSAYDEGFRPIENCAGDLMIASETGDSAAARILPDPARKGEYRSEVGILAPGIYTFRAELFAEGIRLGRFEGKFAVDDIDRETAFADVDWTCLAQTADNSGGIFVSYSNLNPLLDAIDVERIRIEENHDIRLWNNLILLVIIIVSLALEWFIRKRRQLL